MLAIFVVVVVNVVVGRGVVVVVIGGNVDTITPFPAIAMSAQL